MRYHRRRPNLERRPDLQLKNFFQSVCCSLVFPSPRYFEKQVLLGPPLALELELELEPVRVLVVVKVRPLPKFSYVYSLSLQWLCSLWPDAHS